MDAQQGCDLLVAVLCRDCAQRMLHAFSVAFTMRGVGVGLGVGHPVVTTDLGKEREQNGRACFWVVGAPVCYPFRAHLPCLP